MSAGLVLFLSRIKDVKPTTAYRKETTHPVHIQNNNGNSNNSKSVKMRIIAFLKCLIQFS
jgi:hypothetical protein